jgi:hypothetical protein
MPDYIPASDSQFDAFQANYVAYFSANAATWGYGLPETGAMNTAQTNWNNAYAAHLAAIAAAQAAKALKDQRRTELEDGQIRFRTNEIQVNSATTDTHRANLGITIADTTPTPVGPPPTNPVLQVDTSNRLQVIVSFADEGTPTSKAKPSGVLGCEIWMKLDGAVPTDLDDCEFVTLDTRTPHLVAFDGAEAGKPVHFIGRWVSTRGDKGPISETVSATVPG